jgi:metallophosphoesterase (TIGR00282 family)
LKIILIGDIMGKLGRWAVSQILPELKKSKEIDFVIANVENAAGGFGLTKEIAHKVFSYGVDCLTSGNHIWDRREIYTYLDQEKRLLRPANYPSTVPGVGSGVFWVHEKHKVAVLNIQGRIFVKEIDDPFRVAEKEIEILKRETDIIVVDLHAETTSEKQAFGWYLDGRVSAILGTHTHVQTADETILPEGTAFITDVGMTGPHHSVIGIKKEDALARFINQIPKRFTLATEDVKFCAVLVEVDDQTGKAKSIERIRTDVKKNEKTGSWEKEIFD